MTESPLHIIIDNISGLEGSRRKKKKKKIQAKKRKRGEKKLWGSLVWGLRRKDIWRVEKCERRRINGGKDLTGGDGTNKQTKA